MKKKINNNSNKFILIVDYRNDRRGKNGVQETKNAINDLLKFVDFRSGHHEIAVDVMGGSTDFFLDVADGHDGTTKIHY